MAIVGNEYIRGNYRKLSYSMKFINIAIIITCLLSCGERSGVSEKNNVPYVILSNSLLSEKDTLNDQIALSRITEITCNWKLEKGWFPDQDLVFSRTESKTDAMVFIFQKNGAIEYLNKNFGDCPVGAFTLNNGKWELEGQNLTLELRGTIISDGYYEWKIKYKVKKLTTEELNLEAIKVITNIKNGRYVNETPMTNAG